MRIGQKTFHYLILLPLVLLMSAGNAQASVPIYVAVPDGSFRGIWKVADRNGDGDALDRGEAILFAQKSGVGFTDVAVDGNGILYAITEKSGVVYRIEDKNKDGDAKDSGEVTIFRDSQSNSATGLLLKRPLSIATATFFDSIIGKTRVYVYVMDLVHQYPVLLEDMNNDNDANQANEILAISTSGLPFTAVRMTIDEAGRVVAVNPNRFSVVRLQNVNSDSTISSEVTECPANPCNYSLVTEFLVIRQPTLPEPNLERPFGVTISSKGEYFVSDQEAVSVYKLTDLNQDERAMDPGEMTRYSRASSPFDLVADEEDVIYVGSKATGQGAVYKLKDLNQDGDALDSGEATIYAKIKGTPKGLAALLPFAPRALMIQPGAGIDFSLKGPLLVVPNGQSVTMSLRVIDEETGLPVPNVGVGSQVLAGCFSLCPTPDNSRTDGAGEILYTVTRTSVRDVQETLKFWVFDGFGGKQSNKGENVLSLPVVSHGCTPDPVAYAGRDLVVSPLTTATVILDGSGSTPSEGLIYCWTQTGGTDVGLLDECSSDPTVTFTVPDSSQTLTFELFVKNACDIASDPDSVTVTVQL